MAFFESSDELLKQERERVRKQDEENLTISRELAAMGGEYVVALAGLGVQPDSEGFWHVDGEYGSYFVNREGAYLVKPSVSSGESPQPRGPMVFYRPGMVGLSGLKEKLQKNMVDGMSSAAAARVRQESQGA